jgi:hypothetical protein
MGQKGKGITSKRALALFAAVIIALVAALTSPVGAAALRSWERQTSETEPALNITSEEAFEDFMRIQDLDQADFFLGMYTSSALQTTASEIGEVGDWLNSNGLNTRVSIAGTFMDIEFPNPNWNIPNDLDAAWDQGAVPFVNLAVGTAGFGPRTAAEVADGEIDDAIRIWAQAFAAWTQSGTKRAFIAPLQEMNASWVSYGLDPANYKLAYARIQAIFRQEGVPESSVLWVFAPNGWSEPGHEFEAYYPGDDAVDVIGFSAFNFGACVAGGEGWDTFEMAIDPYLSRMNAMAPSKPIVLAQTGTVEQGGDRGTWLMDSFDKLAAAPMFQGLIYFNVSKVEPGAPSCNPVDWRVYNPESDVGEDGFIEAIRVFEGGGVDEAPASYQVMIPLVGNSN